MQAIRHGPAHDHLARAEGFEAWLEVNHAGHDGVWLEIAKRGASQRSITYDEAVDLALCYGWIDGQKRPSDEHHWHQRFTPRTRARRIAKYLDMVARGDAIK